MKGEGRASFEVAKGAVIITCLFRILFPGEGMKMQITVHN